jgi:hypothetical protein
MGDILPLSFFLDLINNGDQKKIFNRHNYASRIKLVKQECIMGWTIYLSGEIHSDWREQARADYRRRWQTRFAGGIHFTRDRSRGQRCRG